MSLLTLGTALLCFVSAVVGEKHWALLVAGSNGYDNYRHQADICHAYHVLHNHGFPDERIIVMMYDDIAHNQQNPYPGNIINQPDGPNVYPGVPKDYIGKDVTPEVFLNVLTGNAEAVHKLIGRAGKVINSGPEDRIFVNFADHGATGLVAFPDDVLYAKDLHEAIKKMHEAKKYKQMVLYIEACESGSMFDTILESDINVFATTASTTHESSYACYYDEGRDAYLGDVYSVMWMQDSDKENLSEETLEKQFDLVKEETNTSHVMQYGDLKMGSLKIADFQGNLTGKFSPKLKYHPTLDAVPSEDVKMETLRKKLLKTSGGEHDQHRSALEHLMKRKQQSQKYFKDVVELVTGLHIYDLFLNATVHFSDFTCYTESVELLRKTCPGMDLLKNDYALRQLRVLANLCETDIPQGKIWAAIGKISFETSLCGVSV